MPLSVSGVGHSRADERYVATRSDWRGGLSRCLTAFTVDPVEAPADELGQAPIRLTMLDASIKHQ